jgi:hypothetical protein
LCLDDRERERERHEVRENISLFEEEEEKVDVCEVP